jgi:RNase adaptor protein for sRNA GlmZ degradation
MMILVLRLRKPDRFLSPWLPHYLAKGNSYLVIALKFTAGHHLSVYSAHALAWWMEHEEL